MKNILITTAISYPNGPPHIGHLYEAILADFVKKALQTNGNNVKLLTGTDEHGKKIEMTAAAQSLTPIKLCDSNSKQFKELFVKVKIDYDYFIRTTEKDHISLVQESISKSRNSGDIYLSTYSGYYNVREESFISNLDAAATNYIDTLSGKPYEMVTEESYFFKLAKYKDYIKQLLETDLIYPPDNFNFERLDTLTDLSISRTSFNWGIPFPCGAKHIVYVWFDALLNYITGAKKLFNENTIDETIHIIGKDIIWFHAVIYPAILKSCGYNQFSKLLIHGFILDKNGIKMSKSLNNVINVDYLMNKYPIEAIRYYLIMDTTWNQDIKFNEERLIELYNNQLIKDFGNIFQRLLALVKPIQNEINAQLGSPEPLTSDPYDMTAYREKIYFLYQTINKELTDKKPWSKTLEQTKKIQILAELIRKLDNLFTLLYPIIPQKIDELKCALGFDKEFKLNITVEKIKAFVAI